MTNPWTAALVGESIGRSDCYDKGPALTRAGLSTWDTPHRGNSFLAAAVAQAGLDNRCCSERSDAACIPICESPDQQIPRQPQQQTDMRSSQPEALQSNSCESAQPYCSLSSRTAADKSNDNSEADAEIAEADYDVAKPSPRETMSVPDSVSPAYRNQTSAEWHDSGSERSVGTGAQAAASRSETRPSQAGSAAMGPAAADTKPACYNQQGSLQQPLRQQQPQQQVLLSQSKQGCQRKQHYTSWTGDYGHLDSPRFTKHRGTAWQAELPSRRDCPHNEPEMHQANAQPMQVGYCVWTQSLVKWGNRDALALCLICMPCINPE